MRWQSLRALSLSLRDEVEEARAACWIRACAVLHNLLIDDGAEPGLWLTAQEREEAQQYYGEDFSRWEQEGDGEADSVGLAGAALQDAVPEGQRLRKRVQEFSRMWRAQRAHNPQ